MKDWSQSMYSPFNEFNTPKSHLLDKFPECVSYNITLIESKNTKERAKAQEVHLVSLNEVFEYSSKSDRCAVLVANISVPLLSTGKQAIAAWHVWHSDRFISSFCARGLATSDDTETLTIMEALGYLIDFVVDSISDIEEIHVFSDSMNAIHHSLDPSIHSVQSSAITMLSVLTPWMEENNNHRIIFHHVSDCEEYVFKPHCTVHNLATSTKIECGLSASCFQ